MRSRWIVLYIQMKFILMPCDWVVCVCNVQFIFDQQTMFIIITIIKRINSVYTSHFARHLLSLILKRIRFWWRWSNMWLCVVRTICVSRVSARTRLQHTQYLFFHSSNRSILVNGSGVLAARLHFHMDEGLLKWNFGVCTAYLGDYNESIFHMN